jgi:hypothetical protein
MRKFLAFVWLFVSMILSCFITIFSTLYMNNFYYIAISIPLSVIIVEGYIKISRIK